MYQSATFYILEIKDLDLLQQGAYAGAIIKKTLFRLIKKKLDLFTIHLKNLAKEKITFRWSGLAFAILAVFSKEKLQVDWGLLEYHQLADELTKNYEAGIYIFSVKDEDLSKLRPNGFYYSIEELDEFAIEFKGTKPANPDTMRDAAKVLEESLSKLSDERVLLLLIC